MPPRCRPSLLPACRLTRGLRAAVALALAGLGVSRLGAEAPLPVLPDAEWQPLSVNAARVADALELLGAPLTAVERARLERARLLPDAAAAAAEIQATLDPRCFALVHLNPESRVKVEPGPAAPELLQGGWTAFLVKVHNEAAWTGPLRVSSPQGGMVYDKEYCAPWDDARPINGGTPPADPAEAAARVRERWLDLELYGQRPMTPRLDGARVEYAILCLRARDAGRRAAVLGFDAGQDAQDLGFRGELAVTFRCAAATAVTLAVKDELGRPATGAFLVRDAADRLYPSPFKRLAPDFFFQPQVYRADGESLALAPGRYRIEFRRGPESVPENREVTIGPDPQTLAFQVRRWIDPAAFGYVSGDHHIHGAGCAHYTTPSLGVYPADIARQLAGEDLKVGAVLTWGPGFDFQRKFFSGQDDPAAAPGHILRYDLEVSGFGSYRTGHLCLLRLRDQHYPGSAGVEGWPTLGLTILRWAKRQGAVTGSPHSGGGLQIAGEMRNQTATYATSLPFYEIPTFDGTGAVEYLVNLTHEVPGPDGRPVPAVDFIAVGNTPYVNELTMWYHTLNCGFRPRAAGETDFPCLSGDRVGYGRTYVRVDGPLTYDAWCQGLAEGRSYVTEGSSHLIDFRVGDTRAGGDAGEVRLERPATVRVRVKVAARLDPAAAEANLGWEIARSQTELTPPPSALTRTRKPAYETRVRPYFWHLERARVAGTRRVPVEVVVNGQPVARREIEADGELRDLEFAVPVAYSSWVAVRILGSSHTNPVFVLVEGKPIRASRRSAQWCLDGVDAVWNRKERFYADTEKAAARQAYDHARAVYRRIVAESAAE
ncbi:MAG: CehA/McbA family metallohydrolase [Opitutaceae bacterium]|nr:CehA/McbA family metallohydrolase [Opitutaceae bacterium]